MKKSNPTDFKIVVSSIGGNTQVITHVDKKIGMPKSYSEIIVVLKAAIMIWEEKKIMYGDTI